MKSLSFASLCVALTLVSLPTGAHATILFSNFSPAGGSGFNTSTNATESLFGGNGGNGLQRIAAPFTVTSSGALTSADMAFRYLGGTNSFVATVTENDTSFSRPNESQTLATATLNDIPSTVGIVTFSFAQTPTLATGRTYWLVISPGAGNAAGRWQRNTSGGTGSAITFQPTGGWDPNSATSPAFRINAVVVPEAGTLALLALGIVPIAAVSRVRRGKGTI